MILRKHYTIYVCNVSLQDRLTVIRYIIHAYPSHACLISFLIDVVLRSDTKCGRGLLRSSYTG